MECCHAFYAEHSDVQSAGISSRLENQFHIYFLISICLVSVSMCAEVGLRYAFIIAGREVLGQ